MSITQDELLTWSQDEAMFLVEQDEELLLSTLDAVPQILHVLDSGKALSSKQATLLEALFVMVYDGDQEELIVKELDRRQELIQRLLPAIPDYLRQAVIPKLALHQ